MELDSSLNNLHDLKRILVKFEDNNCSKKKKKKKRKKKRRRRKKKKRKSFTCINPLFLLTKPECCWSVLLKTANQTGTDAKCFDLY